MEHKLRIASIVMLSAVCVVLIAVLVIGTVSGGLGFISVTGLARGEAVEVERKTVALEDVEALLVETTNIKFHIYTGSEGDSAQVVLYSNMEENRSRLDIQESGSRVEISTRSNRRLVITGIISEYMDIFLPASYSQDLSLKSTSGGFTTEDLDVAGLKMEANSGSIQFEDISCDTYEIQSSSGHIKGGQVQGEGTLRTNSGGMSITALEGAKHQLTSTSGGIRIETVTGGLTAESNSGGINITTLNKGGHQVRSTSGRISLGSVLGELTGNTNSGGISIEKMDGLAYLESTSGSIRVDQLAGGGSMRASSGTIRLERLALSGSLSVKSTSGSVHLEFYEEPNMTLEASSSSGSISTYFGKGDKQLSAVRGDGLHQVDITTSSGSIKLTLL